MVQQVSIDMIANENKVYDEHIDIPVTLNGQELNIKLFPFFRPQEVANLVDGMIEFYKSASTEKVNMPQHEESDFVMFNIVKHFTDLKFSKSKKAKKTYEEFKIAIDSKIFKLLAKSFPEDSILDVYERIQEIKEAKEKLQTKTNDLQKYVKDIPLKSRDLIYPNKVENK